MYFWFRCKFIYLLCDKITFLSHIFVIAEIWNICVVMCRGSAKETKENIIREYDRLVAQEWAENPIRAAFLARGYYVRLIALNPAFKVCSESYIYEMIKKRYKDK